MRSRRDKLKAIAVTAVVLLSLRVQAGEGESTAPGGSGLTAHLAKITALKRETEEIEETTKKLIAEKREAEDDKTVRSLTNEIAEKYKSLKEVSEKLEAETTLVRFHYPEEAEHLDRKYVRFKTKTLKDLESEVGIDGRLDRIHAHVLATFPVPETAKGKPEAPKINPIFVRKPASLEDDVPEKIILKK